MFDPKIISTYVIGREAELRNPAIESIPGLKWSYVNPVFLTDHGLGFCEKLLGYLMNGRTLTAGERGCAQAHFEARCQAHASSTPWCLIVEDDAVIDVKMLNELGRVAANLDPDNRIVVLVTPGESANSEFNEAARTVEIRSSPSTAVVSMISRGALRGILEDKTTYVQVADWPSHFAESKFLRLTGFESGGEADSIIGRRTTSTFTYLASYALRLLGFPILALVMRMTIRNFLSWFILRRLRRDFRSVFKRSVHI